MEDGQDVLCVVVWFLVACELIILVTRLILKGLVWARYGWDDTLAVAAVLFSVAASIAAAFAGQQGLGQTTPWLTNHPGLVKLQLRVYVSELFHVLSIGTIRLSAICMLQVLFSVQFHSRYFQIITATVILWALSSLMVVAFQCELPHVENLALGNCVNMEAFWDSFGAVGILIDLFILLLPTALIRTLKISTRDKFIIVASFAPWTSAIAVAGTSMGFTHQFYETNKALPVTINHALWPWFICAQVLRAVSILSACVPYLKRFIEAFPSGLLQADEIRRHGLTDLDIHHGFAAHHSNGRKIVTYYLRDTDEGDIELTPPFSGAT